MIEQFTNVVLPNGKLNPDVILGRQPLYTGRNGKQIERFLLETENGVETFIFKPLTNTGTLGREGWVHQQLLGSIPICYPKLLITAEHNDPDRHWAIYEDMGELSHCLSENDFKAAARTIPKWHSIPTAKIPSHFIGDKPFVHRILTDISKNIATLEKVASQFGITATFKKIGSTIQQLNGGFESEVVVSHGDFHQGNIANKDNKIIVLDWEYVHLNSVYWDLYCLLDMSHPDFPKRLTPNTRFMALNGYISERTALGWDTSPTSFIRDYHLYAVIHSLWMLLLIEDDFEKGQMAVSKLAAAQKETINSLSDCFIMYEEFSHSRK